MDIGQIVKELAPCGIDCSRCSSFEGGEIRKNSQALLENLGNFEAFASKISEFVPAMKNYSNFREILEFFSAASCKGCRNGGGKNSSCSAKECFKEKNVDFCFQCDEYPCGRNRYNPDLSAKWLSNNDCMKDNGIESFYLRQKEKPRY